MARANESSWFVAVFAAGDRFAVGMPLDAEDLIGIGAADFGGRVGDQIGRPGRQSGAARLEELTARQFDANHVAVAADMDAGRVDGRQRLQEAVVRADRTPADGASRR